MHIAVTRQGELKAADRIKVTSQLICCCLRLFIYLKELWREKRHTADECNGQGWATGLETKSQELHLSLPHGMQGPKDLGNLLLMPPDKLAGKLDWKRSSLGLEPEPAWDAGGGFNDSSTRSPQLILK